MKTNQNLLVIGLLSLFLLFPFFSFAQIPQGYYSRAIGKSGRELQDSLHEIIKNHVVISYDDLWPYFLLTDPAPDDSTRIMDIYSNCTFTVDQHGLTGSNYCDIYNREHAFCQSWMGVSNYDYPYAPCRSDLHHIYPVDSRMNSTRNNNPYSIVNGPDATVYENGSKLGNNSYFCSIDSVDNSQNAFEPIDEYKGDIARSLLYMGVRYLYEDDHFTSSYGMNIKSQLRPWALELMRTWHRNDPVSQKEINRNDAIYYNIQGNRNPFIDHPELVELIWGNDSATSTFQETYVPVVRPVVVHYIINDDHSVTITFDSVMRYSSLQPLTNYYLGSSPADSVEILNNSNVRIYFSERFITGTTYHLTIRRCQTQTSRIYMNDTIIQFMYGDPVFIGWTFDTLPSEWMDSLRTLPANYGATASEALLHFDGSFGSDTIFSYEFQYYGGTAYGDPRETPAATNSFCLTYNMNPKFVLHFSSLLYSNLKLKYALRRTPMAFSRFMHEWSTDGMNYHPIGDTVTLDESNSFDIYLFDLDTITELNEQPDVFIRISCLDAYSYLGNVRFDNICIHGNKCADSVEMHVVTCHDYNWHGHTYSVSGTYLHNFENEMGCDSTEVLHLEIYGPNAMISGDEAIRVGDTATLTASGGEHFLWSTGDTTATIRVSPSVTTVYTVIVSNSTDCQDTTSWRLDVLNKIPEHALSVLVYPNPANETVNVHARGLSQIAVYNVYGQLLSVYRMNGDDYAFSTSDLPAGTYVLCVRTRDGQLAHRKLMIKH